ncbi:MAG TPA: histidinol dehydrogenase, partial [Gammaproteobacteria bacterium]|nr:histidinol dehydrogenase [Gammaproteobacteria bacterium]
MIAIKQLTTTHSDFDQQLQDVLAWNEASDESIHQTVKKILAEVKQRGDAAVLDYTRQFDKVDVDAMAELVLPMSRINAALEAIPAEQKRALEKAAARIDSYHQHQKQASWSYTEADGTVLGQQVTALDKAGLYVPGGKAAYPSSVLMNAIPAKVAGVNELIMVVPTPHGQLNDLVLASAAIAGVDKVITIGGAQAIAALAYGTETIPKVDKIVGPGNIYVATAKGMVFG